MTVGTAYAYRDADGGSVVGVMADSRLSWEEGGHAEIAVKAHDLGARLAVVSAGLGLIGPYAAELTRSIVETTASRAGETTTSLWDATRTFAYFARTVWRQVCEARVISPPRVSEFAVAGFYRDGAPGVAHVVLADAKERVRFLRPRAVGGAGLGCFTIGAAPARDIVAAAYADFGTGSQFADWNEAIASAMLYSMRHEGEPFRSVGGGLAAGLCTGKHDRFIWPLVEVEKKRYFRGFHVPISRPEAVRPTSMWTLSVDVDYGAMLERRVEDERHGGSRWSSMPATYECMLDDLIGDSPMRRSPEPKEIESE